DIDPAVALRLLAERSGNQAEAILNRQSGVLGLSGVSSDLRDILRQAATGSEPRLERTLQVYLWRIRKYLGAYLAVVGRADAVIFTDTIGETLPPVREAVCSGLEVFGLQLDPEKNAHLESDPADIASANSPTRILVVRTNEELAIAREVYRLLSA
ncbi:MAG: acetate kinase, partial [Planctomycetota bacterium]|nr:acetate kinase [Planctomycetota bacterium]